MKPSCHILMFGLLVGLCCPAPLGWAESGTDRDVNATVGIHPMIELTCTPVNLGVWRVPPRETGGQTRIMLDIDYPELGPKISLNTQVAQASAHADWEPQFGTCTLTQSRALDESSAVVTISGNRLLAVTPDGEAYTGVEPGRSGYGIRVDVYAPTLVKIQNGTATFKVGGGMTIPQRVRETDYGGYRTVSQAVISVDDRMR